MSIIFFICLLVSVLIFMWGWYKYRSKDYMVGFFIGAVVVSLLILGNAYNGI